MIIVKNTKAFGPKEVLFDDADYELIQKYKGWSISHICKQFYTTAYIKKNGKWTRISMHRLLMNPGKGMHVDHINHNGLDNRRCNLRVVTPSVNMLNRGFTFKNNTGFPGVLKRHNRYKASITHNKKYIHGGYFSTPQEAFNKIQEMKNKIYQDAACQTN